MTARGARRAVLALVAGAVVSSTASRATPAPARRAPRVVILDDGEKLREAKGELPRGPWPAGPIDLFALRDETLGLQVVVEAGDDPVEDVSVLVEPFESIGHDLSARAPKGDKPARFDVAVDRFVERFVVVERPTGNDHSDDSLAFTAKSAPDQAFLGPLADALVPEAVARARASPHTRAAVWIDLRIPHDAPAGDYHSQLLVRGAGGQLASRPIELRVLGHALPFAAAPAFVYYDTRELVRRMGDASAEPALRALLHAHHLAAVHELSQKTLRDPHALELDRSAVLGAAYSPLRGYEGPGEGVGEGVVAFGAYGALGAPSEAGRGVLEDLVEHVLDGAARPTTAAFLYAVDESCASDWPARWERLDRGIPALDGVRVGETCGEEPSTLAAGVVLQTAPDLDPARARAARAGQGKWVWAYNGIRPAAGPMMLDVPATDLRANAWIAMRYRIERWFYWEATFWFDDNGGGRGGEVGFDPFVVAETFHNKDGDHANGDGILVYPGHQPNGMTDYGQPGVIFPSVRLKNLRRGIEDAGYIALAREIDPVHAEAVLRRIVPRALAWAGNRPSWPQQGGPWLEARRELAAIIFRAEASNEATSVAEGEVVSQGCVAARTPQVSGAPGSLALFSFWGLALVLRGLGRGKFGAQARHGHFPKTQRRFNRKAGASESEQGGAER
jgi:hypothetical protein